VPCEKFSRAPSIIPTSWGITSGDEVAGPTVATIFVRRGTIGIATG
jgi:hypothetical protein